MTASHGIKQLEGRTQLFVDNIKCGGCASTITRSLSELGLQNTVVDTENSTVTFDQTTPDRLNHATEKLRALGYPLVDTEEGLKALALKAKSYVSCAIGRVGH